MTYTAAPLEWLRCYEVGAAVSAPNCCINPRSSDLRQCSTI
jgi:hypothetical protein